MSSEYAGADTYHATVTVVDDADPPVAASFAAGLQDVADRTAYLKGETDAAGTAIATLGNLVPGLDSTTVVMIGAESLMIRSDSAGFVEEPSIRPDSMARVEPPGGEVAFFAVSPSAPGYSYITAIQVYVLGQNYATLPTTQMRIDLYSHDPETGSYGSMAYVVDAPADTSEMNSARRIDLSFSPAMIEPGKSYSVRVAFPSGGTDSGASRWVRLRAIKLVLSAAP